MLARYRRLSHMCVGISTSELKSVFNRGVTQEIGINADFDGRPRSSGAGSVY